MEAEPVRSMGAAVQPVALYRCPEPQWMGRMDAQLVGAACKGAEQHFRPAVSGSGDAVLCLGLFPVHEIHFLARPVMVVRGNGQGDCPMAAGLQSSTMPGRASGGLSGIYYGYVFFPDLSFFELPLHFPVRFRVFCIYYYPGGVHIQPVDTGHIGPEPFREYFLQGSFPGPARDGEYSGWLVGHYDVIVLIQY